MKPLFCVWASILICGCISKPNEHSESKKPKHYISKTLYHKIYQSSSYWHVRQWNVPKDSLFTLKGFYLKEKTDEKGRVSELKIYFQHKPQQVGLCYLPFWITYEYPDDKTIIETFLDEKAEPLVMCEDSSEIYKNIFKLSDDQERLLSVEEFPVKGKPKSFKFNLENYRRLYLYDLSLAKLNGKKPRAENDTE